MGCGGFSQGNIGREGYHGKSLPFPPSLGDANPMFATARPIAAVSRTSRAVSSQILTSFTAPQKKYKAPTCKQKAAVITCQTRTDAVNLWESLSIAQ